MEVVLPYGALFVAAAAFEGAYVAWARSASRDQIGRTTAWSVVTAGLGLLGLRGALGLQLGWLVYLAGIGAGSYVSAYLGRSVLISTDT